MRFLFGVMEEIFRSFAGVKHSITTTSPAFKMFYFLLKYIITMNKCGLLKVSEVLTNYTE